MGGIIIIIGTLILYITGKILFRLTFNFSDLLLLFPFVSYGIIGLIDDLLSIKHHENEGLSVKQKLRQRAYAPRRHCLYGRYYTHLRAVCQVLF